MFCNLPNFSHSSSGGEMIVRVLNRRGHHHHHHNNGNSEEGEINVNGSTFNGTRPFYKKHRLIDRLSSPQLVADSASTIYEQMEVDQEGR